MTAFVLTVDVEPGERSPAPGSHPSYGGFDFAVEQLQRLREKLGARFSWFVRIDRQIEAACGRAGWILEERADVFDALEARGDVLGLHVHPCRWLPERGEWLNDFGNRAFVRECLDLGFATFTRTRGVRPRLFRFGDRYLDESILRELERRGVQIDLTVEAGAKEVPGHVPSEHSTATLPDTSDAPRRPYRPSRFDYRKEARWLPPRALWEVPVTTGNVGGDDIAHLNLGLHPHWIALILEGAMRDALPVIVSVARTGDLDDVKARANFIANVERLATITDRAFVTPFAVVERRHRGGAPLRATP